MYMERYHERLLIALIALPADGVQVSGGRLHVVAVAILGGPFLPRLTAGLHQLLGRHWIEMKLCECSQCFAGIAHTGSAGRDRPLICQRRIAWVTQEVWIWNPISLLNFGPCIPPHPSPGLKAENSKYEMFLILNCFILLRSNQSLPQGNLSLILRLIRAQTEMMRKKSALPFKVGQEKDQRAENTGVLLCLQ